MRKKKKNLIGVLILLLTSGLHIPGNFAFDEKLQFLPNNLLFLYSTCLIFLSL